MPYCKVLDHHMCATVAGRWRPCCAFQEEWDSPEKIHWVESTTFEEYRNSEYYTGIKKEMETGWHRGCHKCQDEESRSQASMRERYSRLMPKAEARKVEFIEISLSAECNIACRMCYPGASTTWQKLVSNNPQLTSFRDNTDRKYSANIHNMFDSVDLSNLVNIKLLGGEPFITPQTTELFEYFDSRSDLNLQNVTLQFNTNATFFPEKLAHLLSKFGRFSVSISIDGYEDNNDYVRSGSKWTEVMEVTRRWIDLRNKPDVRAAIRFTTCISAYNVHEIHKIGYLAEELGIKFGQAFITGPRELRIEALPNEYIEYLIDIYENCEPFQVADSDNTDFIVKYLKNLEFNPDLNRKLIEFTVAMDKATGLQLRDYNPRLAQALNV